MDTSKFIEVFNPDSVKERIHIIGCGSVGSTVAELLARYGLTKFTLWDMDIVEPKNIANQMFFADETFKPKAEVVARRICAVNPDAKEFIKIEPNGWSGQQVRGYAILAVDNIEIRKDFVDKNIYNPHLKAVFDIRTGLYDAQCWSADWSDSNQRERFKDTMNFSHEEAAAETPVSACGIVQGVAPTVRMISCLAVTNIINFATKGELKKMIIADPFLMELTAV